MPSIKEKMWLSTPGGKDYQKCRFHEQIESHAWAKRVAWALLCSAFTGMEALLVLLVYDFVAKIQNPSIYDLRFEKFTITSLDGFEDDD